MANSKYNDLVNDLPDLIGGVDNATYFTHCMTRLRINVKDTKAVQQDKINAIKGVKGSSWAGNQFQIIIGTDVDKAYAELGEKTKLGNLTDAGGNQQGEKKFSINDIFTTVTGCVAPVLPVLIGGGMIKVVLLVCTMIGILTTESPTYLVLNFISDSAFYFLPVFVGAAAAKVFNMNQYVGMFLGAMLIHPTFVSMVSEGTALSIMKLPVYAGTYSSTMFPTMLAVFVASYVEKFFKKYSPAPLRVMLVPFGTVLVMAPITFVVLAPIRGLMGTYLAKGVVGLYEMTGFIGIALLSALYPLLVMTGMHQGFSPYLFQSFAETGTESLLNPAVFVSNINIGAACLAVSLRSKAAEMKQESTASFITACAAGVTEPGLFGIVMKYKTVLVSVMIGNAAGAAVAGLFKTTCYAFAGSYGIFGLATFIGEKGIMNFVWQVVACLIGFAVTFVVTFISFKDYPDDLIENNDRKPDAADTTEADVEIKDLPLNAIASPVNGEVKALAECKDEAFASGALGQGVIVESEDGKIYAPCDGVISSLFDTLHAVGITADNGAEVLIHIGIDTVKLKGEGFTAHIKNGDRIKAGQLMIEADVDFIHKKGYTTTTPVVITNTDSYNEVSTVLGWHKAGDVIINLVK